MTSAWRRGTADSIGSAGRDLRRHAELWKMIVGGLSPPAGAGAIAPCGIGRTPAALASVRPVLINPSAQSTAFGHLTHTHRKLRAHHERSADAGLAHERHPPQAALFAH